MTHPTIERVLDFGIKPNAEAIGKIMLDGGVAVLVFEPDDSVRGAATALGWDGTAPVFRMNEQALRRMAGNCRKMGDWVTAKWLRRPDGPFRIFVIMHAGTLLLNFEPGGFSIEPGSVDQAWMS